MASQAVPATGPQARAPRSPVLEVFHAGAPQITTDEHFTRHIRVDGAVAWDAVLDEPGWSRGQRVLISIAAALCADGQLPAGPLGAYLTGPQTSLVLAMCRAARR